jgi:hypothetical protein
LATCGILGVFGKSVLHLASWHAAVNSALRKMAPDVTWRASQC